MNSKILVIALLFLLLLSGCTKSKPNFVCGNGICEKVENEKNCAVDCSFEKELTKEDVTVDDKTTENKTQEKEKQPLKEEPKEVVIPAPKSSDSDSVVPISTPLKPPTPEPSIPDSTVSNPLSPEPLPVPEPVESLPTPVPLPVPEPEPLPEPVEPLPTPVPLPVPEPEPLPEPEPTPQPEPVEAQLQISCPSPSNQATAAIPQELSTAYAAKNTTNPLQLSFSNGKMTKVMNYDCTLIDHFPSKEQYINPYIKSNYPNVVCQDNYVCNSCLFILINSSTTGWIVAPPAVYYNLQANSSSYPSGQCSNEFFSNVYEVDLPVDVVSSSTTWN